MAKWPRHTIYILFLIYFNTIFKNKKFLILDVNYISNGKKYIWGGNRIIQVPEEITAMCFYNNIPQKREEPSTYNTKSRICTLCKQWPVSGSWEVTFHTRNFPGDKTVIPVDPKSLYWGVDSHRGWLGQEDQPVIRQGALGHKVSAQPWGREGELEAEFCPVAHDWVTRTYTMKPCGNCVSARAANLLSLWRVTVPGGWCVLISPRKDARGFTWGFPDFASLSALSWFCLVPLLL